VFFYLKLTIDLIIFCYIVLNKIIAKMLVSQIKRKNFNLLFYFIMSTLKAFLSSFT